MTVADVEAIAAAADRIRDRIAGAGGDPEAVRLVAVTKGQPVAVLEAATEAGLLDLGESYPQEMAAKVEALHDRPVRWHGIGRLQRNKVRTIAPAVHLWHSVDRLALAAEIAQRAPGAAVLVQVNVSGAEQQGGCAPARVAPVAEGCSDLGLHVRGLMAIGPLGPPEAARCGFRMLRALADELELPERSMGMSADLEAAIAEGSTIVRIGTALFGPRGGTVAVGK
ncbi:MAG: YggS family pyridoxal phosphate-dependent enzyme [Acidimicrobiales bacterium]|nr:YggS family pyridoxal phosphate-dependent enzyme [Acidimicrobiales bacterium]